MDLLSASNKTVDVLLLALQTDTYQQVCTAVTTCVSADKGQRSQSHVEESDEMVMCIVLAYMFVFYCKCTDNVILFSQIPACAEWKYFLLSLFKTDCYLLSPTFRRTAVLQCRAKVN